MTRQCRRRGAELDSALVERLVTAGRQLAFGAQNDPSLTSVLRLLAIANLLGRIGAAMPVKRAEMRKYIGCSAKWNEKTRRRAARDPSLERSVWRLSEARPMRVSPSL